MRSLKKEAGRQLEEIKTTLSNWAVQQKSKYGPKIDELKTELRDKRIEIKHAINYKWAQIQSLIPESVDNKWDTLSHAVKKQTRNIKDELGELKGSVSIWAHNQKVKYGPDIEKLKGKIDDARIKFKYHAIYHLYKVEGLVSSQVDKLNQTIQSGLDKVLTKVDKLNDSLEGKIESVTPYSEYSDSEKVSQKNRSVSSTFKSNGTGPLFASEEGLDPFDKGL